ncbi:MAG: tetraacyldisaccharide 4'-kinase [Rhodospirillaceae bacterium]|nr:tetraacyldisaccharide 4'-kinase [Rhodospirillaceae bacterium]
MISLPKLYSPKHWQQAGPIAWALYPFAIIYQAVATARRLITTPWQADVPVICVGNIVAGGAGKTPMAIHIAEQLKKLGKNPHIVTRGYGGRATWPLMVNNEHNDFDETGDEAILLASTAATWVAKDRKIGVMAAIDNDANAVILDDGFQNPSVKKDISIVVVDGGYGFGNKMVLPAGPLRESIASGISRATAVVIVGDDKFNAKADIKAVNPAIKIMQASLEPINAEEIKNRDVVAFAGIGRPEKFFETLKNIDCNIKRKYPFPDHHPYSENDILPILKYAEKNNSVVVTTEKDAVKIPKYLLEKVFVLKVKTKLSDQDDEALKAMLKESFLPTSEQLEPVSYRPIRLLDYVSAFFAYVGFFLLRLLPLDLASKLGGKTARLIGPFVAGATRTARKNLKMAFPHKSDEEIEEIIKDVWENLGRTGVEFALIDKLTNRISIEGIEHLLSAGKNGVPTIFFGAHMGNWELPLIVGGMHGVRVNAFYRAPNNPLMFKMFSNRPLSGELIPKGAPGAKRAFSLLKKGQSLGILVDQKLNDGISLPFFGRDAMTGTALAEFALRFDAPMVPLQCLRTNGSHFRLIFHPPLKFEKTGEREKDVATIMLMVNKMLEDWIIQNPGQWLWLHRRWPD